MQMIYAHRGASGYAPENTCRAFELACDMGADGVELDVQLTKDRRLVVFHDETIDRVTDGSGAIAEMTYEELLHYPITKAAGADGTDRVPLLQDVLALLKRRGLKVNIELKNSVHPYPGLEELCAAEVAAAGMATDTLYSSFNHYSLLRMKQLLPDAPCGLLYEATLVKPWTYAAALGMNALHPHFSELLVPEEVAESHALGLEVNPWTVNRDEQLRWVIASGADRVITNYPDRALAILREKR